MENINKVPENIINDFVNTVSKNNITHAYIFSGGDSSLRLNTALKIAELLNCNHKKEDGHPCEICSSCKKIQEGNYPDLYFLEPDGVSIKISAVRKIQKELGYKIYEGNYKIVIIKEAENMTTEASNSILKILEEPLGSTIFMVLTNHKQSLLPTIRSRCQEVFLGEEEELEVVAGFNDYVLKLLERDKLKALELSEKIAGNENEFLDNLLKMYRDLLVWKQTASEDLLLNRQWVDTLKQFTIDTENCIKAVEKIQETQNNLNYNSNKNLTMENLFLELVDLQS